MNSQRLDQGLYGQQAQAVLNQQQGLNQFRASPNEVSYGYSLKQTGDEGIWALSWHSPALGRPTVIASGTYDACLAALRLLGEP